MIALLEEGKNTHFPNPNKFDNKGLVAISQHLGVERILQAYRNGIFPWMKMEWEPHYWCWFSPNPRMVLVPSEMKISKSLRRIIDSGKFEIRILIIRIVGNITDGQRIIHVKIQSPVITDTALICKNSKNSEKFELRISNIRIVENLTRDLWIIHAKFQPPVITVTAVIDKNSKN